MQSEEQSELRRYLLLTRACREIAAKIHPYYEKMYPCGVGEMTALDPELSNAPLAMKIEFCELHLEHLRELQSRVPATGATVSSSAASKDNTIVGDLSVGLHVPRPPQRLHVPRPPSPQQCMFLRPVRLQRRLFLRCHLYRSLRPDFYTDGSDIQRGNQLQIGNYFGNSASKKRGDSNVCCTKKSFWTLFKHMNKHRAEKSGSATNKRCKNAKDRST